MVRQQQEEGHRCGPTAVAAFSFDQPPACLFSLCKMCKKKRSSVCFIAQTRKTQPEAARVRLICAHMRLQCKL